MPNIDLAERIKIIGQRIREGRDTYAGRLDAWHQLGTVFGQYTTWKELCAAAGADFPVLKAQLEFKGVAVDAWGTFRIDPAVPKGMDPEKSKLIELPDGRKFFMSFLAAVGSGYEVIPHTEGFEVMDHLIGQIDGAHYETMGTLEFGRQIWGQANPNVSIHVGDDEIKTWLTFRTGHDGTTAFDCWESATRIVCRNTFRMAGSELKGLTARLRVAHRKGAMKRIESLKTEIDEIKSVALSMEERLTWLSQRRVTRESITSIFKRLFPPTVDDDGVETSSGRRDNILAAILERYEYNDGDAFPEQRGSAYNLFNSVTEYTDHYRSSKADGRALAATFGSGDRLKTNALDIIMEEAETMPLLRSAQTGLVVDFAEAGLNVPNVKSN